MPRPEVPFCWNFKHLKTDYCPLSSPKKLSEIECAYVCFKCVHLWILCMKQNDLIPMDKFSHLIVCWVFLLVSLILSSANPHSRKSPSHRSTPGDRKQKNIGLNTKYNELIPRPVSVWVGNAIAYKVTMFLLRSFIAFYQSDIFGRWGLFNDKLGCGGWGWSWWGKGVSNSFCNAEEIDWNSVRLIRGCSLQTGLPSHQASCNLIVLMRFSVARRMYNYTGLYQAPTFKMNSIAISVMYVFRRIPTQTNVWRIFWKTGVLRLCRKIGCRNFNPNLTPMHILSKKKFRCREGKTMRCRMTPSCSWVRYQGN